VFIPQNNNNGNREETLGHDAYDCGLDGDDGFIAIYLFPQASCCKY
jgi:hypothetical protein